MNVGRLNSRLYKEREEVHVISEEGALQLKTIVERNNYNITQTIQFAFDNGFKQGITEALNIIQAENMDSNKEGLKKMLNEMEDKDGRK